MSDISRAGGPSPIDNSYSQSDDKSVTTVQVGENNLSDVAGRLGVDSQDLQKANPQLSDTSVLKAGQEIKLPQNQGSQGPSEGRDRDDDGVRDKTSAPPSSPIGDPLVKGFIQSKLDGAGKQTDFSEKDLGQTSGGASAGRPSTTEYKPHGSNPENVLYQKVGFSEQSLGQTSGGAAAGKFQGDFQKIHLEDEDRFTKGHEFHRGGDEFIKGKISEFPKKDSVGTEDGQAFGKESLSQRAGHADIQINKVVDKSSAVFFDKTSPLDKTTPLSFEKVAGGEPLEQVSLNFEKIKVSYDAQKQDGASGGPVIGGWDVKANQKV